MPTNRTKRVIDTENTTLSHRLSVYDSEFNSHRLRILEFNNYKILTLTHLFYSGCIFTVFRTEALGSSLLVCLLPALKILGSNYGILGLNEEILGHVFELKRAAETEYTNIE